MSAPKKNVAYMKPEEPSFLKSFKAKVGYKEPASLGKWCAQYLAV